MAFDLSPPRDCGLCPRLAAFRAENRALYPGFANAPVESFGPSDAWLIIVGLAPGLKGANRTGRPFTGDYAGDLLYATLLDLGLARGVYDRRPDDGLTLDGAAIVNAVRCVPPQNKPTPAEIGQCRPFLAGALSALPRLRTIFALGRIAHDSVLRALGARLAAHPFAHGARHDLGPGKPKLFDSYHCSRYNTNTGVLTPAMFHDALRAARDSGAAESSWEATAI
jgi:uracil-DNA glycosylase family 4